MNVIDETLGPISYISRTLTEREQKYGLTELEALALVWSTLKLHLYLYRTYLEVFTDQKYLEYICNSNSKRSAKSFNWQSMLRFYCTLQTSEGEVTCFRLSRLCQPNNNNDKDDVQNSQNSEEAHLDFITNHAIPCHFKK